MSEPTAEGLTEAEVRELSSIVWPGNYADPDLEAICEAVERILADRLAAVQAERDREREQHDGWARYAGHVEAERDHWRGRFERMRLMYRERFNGGLSNADWHAKHCAALAALANAWDEGYEEAIGDTEARSAPPGPNGPVDPTRNPYRAAVEGGRS